MDEYLRVHQSDARVLAMGDCAADTERPLVPLAKVAEQQGKYLANCINQTYSLRGCTATPDAPFKYVDIGPIKGFGIPSDESARDQWPDYSLAVDDEVRVERQGASEGNCGKVVIYQR